MPQKHRIAVGAVAASVAALGVVGAGSAAAVGAPSHSAQAVASTPKLKVTIGKHHFSLSGPRNFQAGRVALKLKAKGGEFETEVASFKSGYSFHDFKKDVAAFGNSYGPNGPTKSGLKHLNRAVAHTTVYGGLDVTAGTGNGTIELDTAGTYYVFNDSNVPSSPKKLTVSAPEAQRASAGATATVTAKSNDRFGGAKTLPAKGTITFKNVSHGKNKSPHFLDLQHVKNGTTKKQVQSYLTSGSSSTPSFIRNGTAGTDAISPGLSQTLTYHLPKGEYVELCFFPDLKTGAPHADMGMIRVVHLK